MQRRWAVIGWVAPVAFMLMLVTSNVGFSVNSLWLYERLFERNEVPARTGISMEGLRGVGAQIQDYFASDKEPLEVTAVVDGVELSLFDGDEASHMADVKQLFRKTYGVQWASGIFLLIITGVAVLTFRRRSVEVLASWLRRGAIITAASILAIGIASVVAFDQVFLLFHQIGFPQGNFQFSSQTDYLVLVFPNGFWEDITLVIGVMTLVEAAAAFVVSIAMRRAVWRWQRQAPLASSAP